jgi:hypothetical protein
MATLLLPCSATQRLKATVHHYAQGEVHFQLDAQPIRFLKARNYIP